MKVLRAPSLRLRVSRCGQRPSRSASWQLNTRAEAGILKRYSAVAPAYFTIAPYFGSSDSK